MLDMQLASATGDLYTPLLAKHNHFVCPAPEQMIYVNTYVRIYLVAGLPELPMLSWTKRIVWSFALQHHLEAIGLRC